MAKSKLKEISEQNLLSEGAKKGVVALLLKDHRAMRELMKVIRSPRSQEKKVVQQFSKLEHLVSSHVVAEEYALLNLVLDNPLFEDEALEGIEEHNIHKTILAGIHRVKDLRRKVVRMKIFCEILEQHLDEEQEELFPKFKKYAALSTRKKLGKKFLKTRKATAKGEKIGALG